MICTKCGKDSIFCELIDGQRVCKACIQKSKVKTNKHTRLDDDAHTMLEELAAMAGQKMSPFLSDLLRKTYNTEKRKLLNKEVEVVKLRGVSV